MPHTSNRIFTVYTDKPKTITLHHIKLQRQIQIIIPPVNPTPQSPVLDTSESTFMCSPTTDQDAIEPQLATNTVAITTQISTPQKETTSLQTTQQISMDTTTTTKRKDSLDPEKTFKSAKFNKSAITTPSQSHIEDLNRLNNCLFCAILFFGPRENHLVKEQQNALNCQICKIKIKTNMLKYLATKQPK